MKSIINRRGSKAATRALKHLERPQQMLSSAKPTKARVTAIKHPMPHKKG